MEILEAIDRLDDQMLMARPIPLTDQVRIDKSALLEGVGAIRHHVDVLPVSNLPGAVERMFGALVALEAMATSAKPVWGSEQVRLNRQDFLDELNALRAAVAVAANWGDGTPSPWDPVLEAIDEIQTTMHAAPRTPFSHAIKIDGDGLRRSAARIRTAAAQNAGPPGPVAEFHAALDDLDELARGEGTLKLPPDDLWNVLERLLRAAMRAEA